MEVILRRRGIDSQSCVCQSPSAYTDAGPSHRHSRHQCLGQSGALDGSSPVRRRLGAAPARTSGTASPRPGAQCWSPRGGMRWNKAAGNNSATTCCSASRLSCASFVRGRTIWPLRPRRLAANAEQAACPSRYIGGTVVIGVHVSRRSSTCGPDRRQARNGSRGTGSLPELRERLCAEAVPLVRRVTLRRFKTRCKAGCIPRSALFERRLVA